MLSKDPASTLQGSFSLLPSPSHRLRTMLLRWFCSVAMTQQQLHMLLCTWDPLKCCPGKICHLCPRKSAEIKSTGCVKCASHGPAVWAAARMVLGPHAMEETSVCWSLVCLLTSSTSFCFDAPTMSATFTPSFHICIEDILLM